MARASNGSSEEEKRGPDVLCESDAVELASLIRAREVSPVEVLEAHLARISQVNPNVNAVVTLNDDAMAEALRAEAAVARREPLGALHGVPFTVKDSFDSVGMRATRGSILFEDHVARHDATAVRRIRDAGGVLLGKTNVPEFVLWAETDNRVFGPTRHPLDPARTPGGSSGGEAAAISTGMSPLGIASDLSGSIRLPAHYCGIVGLKPTHGRVPLTGHWPDTLQRFTHVGPMARSVRDARLALDLLEGRDGHDWFAEFSTMRPPRRPGVDELRIGWMAGEAFGPLQEEVASAVSAAAEALMGTVRSVEPVSIPRLENCDYDVLTLVLYGAESGPFFESVIDGRADDLHPTLRARLEQPRPGLSEYLAAESAVEHLRRGLLEYFNDFDILLCPVGPVAAPVRDRPTLEVEGQERSARQVLRATIPFDLAGVPAVSVPFATSDRGLPIGVQVVGRWSSDHLALDVAQLLMQRGHRTDRPTTPLTG